jgi:hypothetical protein
LVYKGCKKNVHRLWKLNGDKGKSAASTSSSGKYAKAGSLFGASLNGRDDEKIKRITDQTIQENIRTTEKMNQLRLKMELANARKKLKSIKFPSKSSRKLSADGGEKLSKKIDGLNKELHENGVDRPMSKVKEPFSDKAVQRQMKQERYLSAESKMKIKENLSRNRSFKTILSPASSSLSFFNNDLNPLEFCFSGNENKLGRSLSFQSNYVFNRTDSNLCVNNVNSLATMESNSQPIIQEYPGPICEEHKKPSAYSTSMQDLLLKEFLTKECAYKKSTPRECAFVEEKPKPGQEINEYFILPKLLIREDEKEGKDDNSEFYDNSSSTSSLYNCFPSFHQPSTSTNPRFYHSDLDLNQLNDRFKDKLSISNQDINASDGDSDWSRSNLLLLSAINQTKDEPGDNNNIIEDVNYDKFLNDLLSTDYGTAAAAMPDEASGVTKPYPKDSELIDLFGNDLDSTLLKKTTARRIPPMKKPVEKLKSFGSNPTLLGHHHHSMGSRDSSNLAATTTTSTSTVHIPQLSRLDAIPTKYRRGKFEGI